MKLQDKKNLQVSLSNMISDFKVSLIAIQKF